MAPGNGVWHHCPTPLSDYLRAQVDAGVDVVQVFDSRVGALSPADYREFVQPHVRALFDALANLDVPTIHFGTGTATLLDAMRDAGGDVIGVDWCIPLDTAWDRIGDRAVQGNLDPTLLLAPLDRRLAAAPGFYATGSGFRGVGIPDSIADARATAASAAACLSSR
jgi:uroporphyrinogen decarboxylase